MNNMDNYIMLRNGISIPITNDEFLECRKLHNAICKDQIQGRVWLDLTSGKLVLYKDISAIV